MKKVNKAEIGRFLITGVLASTADFIFLSLTSFLVVKIGLSATGVWGIIIATTIGFIASLVVNYVLSKRWVYQDLDKAKLKKHWKSHVSLFIILNIIGLFIRIAIMSGFKVGLWNGLHINIDGWMYIDIPSTYSFWQKVGAWFKGVFTSPAFGWFLLAFLIKNVVILLYNYLTWKKFVFITRKSK